MAVDVATFLISPLDDHSLMMMTVSLAGAGFMRSGRLVRPSSSLLCRREVRGEIKTSACEQNPRTDALDFIQDGIETTGILAQQRPLPSSLGKSFVSSQVYT